MNFSELRGLCVERLGEYSQQAVASNTESTYGDATVLSRMKLMYHRLYSQARKRGPERFASTQSFDYTADAESIDITSVPTTDMGDADILQVYNLDDADRPVVVPQIQSVEYDSYLDAGVLPDYVIGRFAFFLEGNNMYLIPKPASAVTLRARYVAELSLSAITTTTWASHSPDKFPERFHELIALQAALSFYAEGEPPSFLVREHEMVMTDFIEWAADDRSPGIRRVLEVN